MSWDIALNGLYIIIAISILTWLISVFISDVSIVDSVWSIMFLASASYYYSLLDEPSLRTNIIFAFIILWSLRLAIHLTWRNWGEPEDKRYQDIRKNYSPHFEYKSVYIIFLFQALLAWVISAPLYYAFQSESNITPNSLLDSVAIALFVIGFSFEAISDYQLNKFKSDSNNKDKVMNTGLWKYSRHPNYFGEFMIWWAFYLFVIPAAPVWVVASPLLMSWLLLKFSGVVMLEENITNRRPKYKDYIASTNVFFPGPNKK